MARISHIITALATALLTCKGQFVYDCPLEWVSFGDHCYHFVFYPTLPFDEASQACHQDGASLVSVNTGQEHNDLVGWLARYDASEMYEWYTSGFQRGDLREWSGDGDSMTPQDIYWIIDPATELQVSRTFPEAHLVYRYSDEHKGFGWAWASRTQSLPYICEINRDEVYRLYQRTRDFSYGNPSPNPGAWQIGPKFRHVSPGIVFAGRAEQITLECSAEGNPSPSYKWYKDYATDREKLVTATVRYTVTNGRLTISDPVEQEDPGTFTCVAENSVGKVFSPPVPVYFGFLNEFSNTKPGSRTAQLYQGAVIDCSPPSYNPALVYQWMKNMKQNIRPEMNPHTFLSENGNLYFSEVQAADAAEYHCIITLVAPPGEELASSQPIYGYSRGIQLNIQGEDANEFGPDIHDDFPTVFPQQPLQGKEMRIECLAYGRLPLHYSWSRVDGGTIPMERASFTSLNRVMHIADARLEDSGTYMCTVQGPKNVGTKNITLNVAAAPYFLFPLLDQHLDVGSHLTWVCDAVAIPRAKYAWYRDGQLLASNTNTSLDVQVQNNVLTINSADPDKHSGMYECVATNDHGTMISIAQIRVLSFAPTFDKEPIESSIMGSVGGNLTVFCRPEAAPQPTITWERNGSPLGTSGRAQTFPNGTLVLQGLSTGDNGVYTCKAENSLGTAQSSGRLTVLTRTTLFQRPSNTQVHQNSTAFLPCQASYAVDRTDLTYAWYFNNYLIDFNNDPSLSIAYQGGVEGLYIVGATYDHEGFYECRATTVYDSVNAHAYLTVMGPPDAPGGVHVHSHVGTEVTLWWQMGHYTKPPRHGREITSLYRIHFSSNYNPQWRVLVDSIPAYTTTFSEEADWQRYIIQANTLSPGTRYQFRVTAASPTFGYGEPSVASASIKLEDAAPIHAPEFVSGGGGSVGMLRVWWLPLAPENHGGYGLYYKVFWRMHRNPDDMWRGTKNKIYGDKPDRYGFVWFHQVVGEDYFYTQYDVKVQAVNDMGAGPNSTEEIVLSAEDIPVTTPQNVYAEGLNASAGCVYWDLPNNTREGMRGQVQGYQLNWWHWGEDNQREIIRFIRHYGTERSGVIIGLFANDDYWVDVQVFNTAGLSRPSGRAYLNTNYEAPLHYPDYVTVMSNGPDSVRVSWRGVSTEQIEAPVSGYKIWYWPYTDDIRTATAVQFGKVFSGIVDGLEMDKIYKLRVLATSDGGDGKKTPPTLFTLGGMVRFNPETSEVMASATLLKPSLICIVLFSAVSLYQV